MIASSPDGGVPLGDAIAALRSELARAWWDGRHAQLRFKVAPVELTLEVAVTRSASAKAGVRWWLLEAAAEGGLGSHVTQTVKLTLEPVVFDADGQVQTVFIDAADDAGPGAPPDDEQLSAPG
jgi:hypothetical protein